MVRGEFIRGDGLVLPNNFTTEGMLSILKASLRNETIGFYMGLVRGIPSKTGTVESLEEPTFGTGGYARQLIERSSVGWDDAGIVGGEAYAQTKLVTFPATGNYTDLVNRLMIHGHATNGGAYISLSVPMPADLQITAATPLAQRQFRYKLYMG